MSGHFLEDFGTDLPVTLEQDCVALAASEQMDKGSRLPLVGPTGPALLQ